MSALNILATQDEVDQDIMLEFLLDTLGTRTLEELHAANENLVIWQCKKRVKIRADILINNLRKFINSFNNNDLYISSSTYCAGKGKYKTENIYAVYSFAIDVDFKNDEVNQSADPLTYYHEILAQELPIQPNWIEYGRNLRLIYILREPIKAQLKSSKKMLKALKEIQRGIVKKLNQSIDCHAEIQAPHKYYRIEGSINSKSKDIIKYEHINNYKWSIQELIEELYEESEYKYHKNKKNVVKREIRGNTEIYKIYNSYQLWYDRKKILERIAIDNATDNRELLHYLYGLALLYTNETNIIDKLVEFSQTTKNPYSKRQIISRYRTLEENFQTKKYKHTNQDISNMLGLNEAEREKYNLMTKREAEKIEKIKNGETRKQKAEANYNKAIELYQKGYNRNDIAEITGLSVKSIINYIQKYRKLNNITTRNK